MTIEEKRKRSTEYNRVWRAANRDRCREHNRRNYARNKKTICLAAQQKRLLHPERMRAIDAKYRENNPEQVKATRRKYQERHRNERNEQHRKYYLKHADELRARSRQRYQANAERGRFRHYKTMYGLSEEEVRRMRLRQGGTCAACEHPFTSTPHVDHDHVTGVVRGLLCGGCNRACGLVNDSPIRLRALAAYLERTMTAVA